MTAIDDWLRWQLAAALDGRPVIVMTDALVPAASLSQRLRDAGVHRQLVIAGFRGTGEIDTSIEASALLMGTSGVGIMGSIRAFLLGMANPTEEIREAIEAFDPGREAIVVGPLFGEVQSVLGRPVFGARPWTWQVLEDKTTVDQLWDRAGVKRAPSQVVDARLGAMEEAARTLDEGAGTVWVADNRNGWHGGAEFTRWVTSESDTHAIAAELAMAADRVRVMPFLEGLPCSIHGWVIGDHVTTFRPVEMVVLRNQASSRFVYAGAATSWQPDADVVNEMQAVAMAVGRLIRDEVGYRGVFTIDGVLTSDGFRPTEMNPRFGAGMGAQARSTGLPLYLLHAATISNPELDWRPDEFETLVREAAASDPSRRGHVVVSEVLEPGELRLGVTDGRFVLDEHGPVTVTMGPSGSGGLLTVEIHEDLNGRAISPFVAAAINAIADEVGHGLPHLTAPSLAS